jgi:hypothetical protein
LRYVPGRQDEKRAEHIKNNGEAFMTEEEELSRIKDEYDALSFLTFHSDLFPNIPQEFMTRKVCLKAIEKYGGNCGYVPESVQSEGFFLDAVKTNQNGRALNYVPEKYRTFEVCAASVQKHGSTLEYVPDALQERLAKIAIEQSGLNLRYVKEQTPELCLAAVKDAPYAFIFVKEENYTPEVCIEAVRHDGTLLRYIKPEMAAIKGSPQVYGKICLEAVKREGRVLWMVDPAACGEMYHEICLAAISQDGAALVSVKYPSGPLVTPVKRKSDPDPKPRPRIPEDICIAAIEKNPLTFQLLAPEEQTPALCRLAVSSLATNMQYIEKEKHTDELWMLALTQNGAVLSNIKEPTREMQLAALSSNGAAIDYIADPDESMIELARKTGRKRFLKLQWAGKTTIKGDDYLPDAGLTRVEIPEGITTLGEGSFQKNPLESVVIAPSVTLLGTSVFTAKDYFNQYSPRNPFDFPLTSITLGWICSWQYYGYGMFGNSECDTSFSDAYMYNNRTPGSYTFDRELCQWRFEGKPIPYKIGKSKWFYILNSKTENITLSINEHGKLQKEEELKRHPKMGYCKFTIFYPTGNNDPDIPPALCLKDPIVRMEDLFLYNADAVKGLKYKTIEGWPKEITIPGEIEGIPVRRVKEVVAQIYAAPPKPDSEYDKKQFDNIPERHVEKIWLPDSITIFEDGAFSRCTVNINIPSSLEYIGNDAMPSCPAMTGVHIPASVEFIGDYFFSNNESLKAITVDSGNACYKSVDGVLFDLSGENLIRYPPDKEGESYAVPDGVTAIKSGAFCNCKNLKRITLPKSIKTLGSNAFQGCKSLESFTLPEGLPGISFGLFGGCKNLKEVFIPEGVRAIDRSAFEHCESLVSAILPDSINNIMPSAFVGCTSLKSIKLPKDLDILPNAMLAACKSLKKINLPIKITELRNSLSGCKSLTHLFIPPKCKKIDKDFGEYENLSSVILPKDCICCYPAAAGKIYSPFSRCRNLSDATFYDPSEKTPAAGISKGTVARENGEIIIKSI